ncbi:uncharacterized protein F4807DRAFT_458314 [Annulohypoxylon truncatum]|uniref:uncharacterized protein n=1 Tax=Annulohypoxylon truncatum TaxID=327061 RepID=UPI0020089221|nr:uncharacterized protein F4807DRAFT_458314 [Annulohypoxylon truncatum]KAI1212112.1 hypothetical protein F4807DRAFT_458314 [Annulohypoxylon truncatum]
MEANNDHLEWVPDAPMYPPPSPRDQHMQASHWNDRGHSTLADGAYHPPSDRAASAISSDCGSTAYSFTDQSSESHYSRDRFAGQRMTGTTGFGGYPGANQLPAYLGNPNVNRAPENLGANGPMNGRMATNHYTTNYGDVNQRRHTMGVDYRMNNRQAIHPGMTNYDYAYQQPAHPNANYHSTMGHGTAHADQSNSATLVTGNPIANRRHQAYGAPVGPRVGGSVLIHPPAGSQANGANVPVANGNGNANANANNANAGPIQGAANGNAGYESLECTEPSCTYKTRASKRARGFLANHVHHTHCGNICMFEHCGHREADDKQLRIHIKAEHSARVLRTDEGKWRCPWLGCTKKACSRKGNAVRCMFMHNHIMFNEQHGANQH